MSTYVLMKILESAPSRYDKGIRLLTFGRLEKAYDRLTSAIRKEERVLDIGCGTGALTLKAAEKGAWVKGIDINPQMLDTARARAEKAHLSQNIELFEMGAAELGKEKEASFDVVISGLCFSELSDDEFNFTLREIKRILKPGGLLLLADEVRPKNIFKKIIHWLSRLFFRSIVYLFTGTKTKAIKHLPERIRENGFEIVSLKLNKWENFLEVVATKSKEAIKELR